jgi:predicted Zn finger-like uncharacterized protein
MPLTIQCPACAQRYQIQEDRAGKQVRCKKCGTTFAAAGDAPAPESFAPLTPAARPGGIDLAALPPLAPAGGPGNPANPLGAPLSTPRSFPAFQPAAAHSEVTNPSGGPTDTGMRLISGGSLLLGLFLLGINLASNSLQGAVYLMPLVLGPLMLMLGITGLISPNVVRAGGKFGGHLPWRYKAMFYGLMSVWLVIAIAIAIGLVVGGFRPER